MPQNPLSLTTGQNDTLEQLLLLLSQSRAILRSEAESHHGTAGVRQAIAAKYLGCTKTPLGPIVFLAHKGRRRVGLCGAYYPTLTSLLNAVALRKVVLSLEQKGHTLQPLSHRTALQGQGEQGAFVVVARYTGYDHLTVHRMLGRFIKPGLADQLWVYLPEEKLTVLQQASLLRKELEAGRLKFCCLPKKT